LTNEEKIAANAALVIQAFSENRLGFDERSVHWIDGYIERNREFWDKDMRDSLGNTLGSFLGECIRHNFGGKWDMTENGLGLMFDSANGVFPFNKVSKQIENGAGDSIVSFYDSISVIFKNQE
jgi:hypothetical protein